MSTWMIFRGRSNSRSLCRSADANPASLRFRSGWAMTKGSASTSFIFSRCTDVRKHEGPSNVFAAGQRGIRGMAQWPLGRGGQTDLSQRLRQPALFSKPNVRLPTTQKISPSLHMQALCGFSCETVADFQYAGIVIVVLFRLLGHGGTCRPDLGCCPMPT